MNREEILSKVKTNGEPDEMELSVLIKSLGISTIVIPIMCLIFIIIRLIAGKAVIDDLVAITFAQLFVSELYSYKKCKKIFKLIISIVFLAITLIETIMFLNGVI